MVPRKIRIVFPVLLFGLITSLSAQNFEIKSLRTYSAGDETGFPIAPVTIEFDLKAEVHPDLMIVFKFCDENWMPYENLMLQNLGYDKDYQLWFEDLPTPVLGADFHFQRDYPNKNINFPFSGKWKFFIVDKFDEAKVFAEGRFYSVIPKFGLSSKTAKERLYKEDEAENTEGRALRLETSFNIPPELFPHLIDHIEIVENRLLDYPIVLDTETFDNLHYYEFDGVSNFTFVIRDLYPGNNYRAVDLRDHRRFIGPEVDADIDVFETENYFKLRPLDLNGSSNLLPWENRWSDYLITRFTLRPDVDEDDRVFIVGAFNNWKISSDFEMFNNDGLFTFETPLKRGRYDYQYVVYRGEEYFDWFFLEGNFYETSNEYNIFVFYNSEDNGGFSEIVGHQKIEIVNGKIKNRADRSRASRKTSPKTVKRNFNR